MAKYSVHAIYSASKHLGVFEADNIDEAEEKAASARRDSVSICNVCSNKIDIGDCYGYQTEEVE